MLPREKLQTYGANTLSNDELLAIIIGSGTKEENVFDLSKRILLSIDTIADLKEMEYEELIEIKGIKKAKATKIIASIELAKRIFSYVPKDLKFENPKDTFEFLRYDFYGKKQEEFMVLFLNKRLQLIKKKVFAVGNANFIQIDLKALMRYALKLSSDSIILVHNHPSDSLKPSNADLMCTTKILEAAKFFDIVVIDHIIIGLSGYYSFMEHHKLNEEFIY